MTDTTSSSDKTPSFEMTWGSSTSSGYCSEEEPEFEQYFTARTSFFPKTRKADIKVKQVRRSKNCNKTRSFIRSITLKSKGEVRLGRGGWGVVSGAVLSYGDFCFTYSLSLSWTRLSTLSVILGVIGHNEFISSTLFFLKLVPLLLGSVLPKGPKPRWLQNEHAQGSAEFLFFQFWANAPLGNLHVSIGKRADTSVHVFFL